MRSADHKHIVELIPAYALGALDPDELEAVQRHLVACSACQEELSAYSAVVDALPLAALEAAPSPALRDQLMTRVQAPPEAAVSRAASSSSPWRQFADALRGLAAGPRWQLAALIVIIALVASNLLLWQRVNEPAVSTSWRRVILTGTEAAPEATGIIYISEDGRNGTLIVDRLPELSQAQQYQLWLIDDGQRSSGGVFSVPGNGYFALQIESARPLRDFGAFGITIEPAGGSPGPTGERVLGSNL